MTFIGKVSGLKAASLHAQYLEEYFMLSKKITRLYIITDIVESRSTTLSENMRIVKLPRLRIPKLYGFTKIFLFVLSTLFFAGRYDVLYVRTFSPPELTALWFCSRVLRKPSILVLPGTWLFHRPNERVGGKTRLFRFILKMAMYSASRIVLYSRRMLPEIIFYAPSLDGRKITIIRNGVNIRRFRKNAPRPEAVTKIIGDRPYIYYVGRINEKKGVLDLVEAYSIVAERLGSCPPLLLFGEVAKEIQEKLKNIIKAKNLSGRVFIAGPIPNSEVPGLAANSLFIVYATREGEGIPRAIVEAMACSRPAVATEVAGIPDIVRDGETGYVVKPRDINALANKIIELITSEELREKMGANARRLVEEEFSYDKVIPQISALIKKVASKK